MTVCFHSNLDALARRRKELTGSRGVQQPLSAGMEVEVVVVVVMMMVVVVVINGQPRSSNLFAFPLDAEPNGDQRAYFLLPAEGPYISAKTWPGAPRRWDKSPPGRRGRGPFSCNTWGTQVNV